MEGISTGAQINFIIVFLEGLFSFFSPCVIPLIPVYISILAGNAKQTDSEGKISYKRSKVLLHTSFFIIGISCAFFLLGMTFSAAGTFFDSYKQWITRIGGILIVFMGLFQLGVLNLKFMQREKKIHLKLGEKEVNPFTALVMGFTFSFGWTPCIGPALSSVLIMASSAKSGATGNLLILVYTLGFVIPFLLLGLFTTQVLNFLNKNKKFMLYTVKIAGALLVIVGIIMFTGRMNGISSYLNSFTKGQSGKTPGTEAPKEPGSSETGSEETKEENEKKEKMPIFDFTLTDQNGNVHTLSEYKGKVIFLNFWATWCGPCRVEMPHIEELYKELGYNEEDVVFLGVANPKSNKNPNAQDGTIEEINTFLDENELTFPVVFDETGEVFSNYRISAFPTTFMIDVEGNVFGYVTGTITKEIMLDIIQQTKDSVKE